MFSLYARFQTLWLMLASVRSEYVSSLSFSSSSHHKKKQELLAAEHTVA